VVEVRGLCAWLIQRERAGEALQWLTNLPSAARSQQPVQLATTECYVALKDWPAVQAFLKDQHWAESEFLREAFLSQAALRAEEPVAAGFHWKNAVREAGDRIGPMAMLLDLAGTWQRSGDKADLLWRVYGRYPKERWALQELARIFRAEKNTLGLYKLSVELEKLNPDDPVAKNNLAATSLLLKLNVSKAYEVAKELHTSRPDDPIIASTYAFALHLLGRTQEGVAVLAQLKPAALEEPAVALYYGVLLSASGQAGQAKKYLNLCHAAPLLPEEQQLLDDALTSL
jgi:hypothetical protein